MKKSELIAGWSIAFAALATVGIYWCLPSFPWWAYLVIGFAFYAGTYQAWIKQKAELALVDGETSARPRYGKKHGAAMGIAFLAIAIAWVAAVHFRSSAATTAIPVAVTKPAIDAGR